MKSIKKILVCSFSASFALLTLPRVIQSEKSSAASVGRAECVIELHSRRVLYEYNADTRLPMASTTKIATAITALDAKFDLQEEIIIPKEAVGVDGSSVYLKEGEKYSLNDLLYGLMLRSGNDAAKAIALTVGGSEADFSAMMNATAQKAGALATNFVNPHGLPQEKHYTTARDLSYITAYAMHNSTFCEIVGTKYYEPRGWQNKNKLLYRYEGACGVKTGYTKEAGRCLVSSATKNQMTLICSLLNCSQTYERTEELFNDCFSAYQNVPIVLANRPFPLAYKGKFIKAYPKEDFYYPLLEEEKSLIEIKTKSVKEPFKEKGNEKIGEFEIYLSKQLLFSGNLYKL